MTTLEIISYSIGGSGLLSLIIQLFFKFQADKDIRRLESKLARQNFVHSQVFIKTEDAIVSTYNLMRELITWSRRYTSVQGQSKLKTVTGNLYSKAMSALVQNFESKRLYIPKPTANRIESVIKTMRELIEKHNLLNKPTTGDETEVDMFVEVPAHQAEFEKIKEAIPALMLQLEDDFQYILGLSEKA
jgi:hypothetical protein